MKDLNYYLSLPYKLEIIPDIEEGGYAAKYPDLPGCVTCADSLSALLSLAEDAKREWLCAAIEDGIAINEPSEKSVSEYSGQFKLRLPKSLHKNLAEQAKHEGISMNQYCLFLLAQNHEAHVMK